MDDTAGKIASLFDSAKNEALALLREREGAHAGEVVNADDDEGITAEDAAQMIGVKKWRVYDMIRRGILPASRPSPNTVRVRRGAVREFIRTGSCEAVPEDKAKVLPLRGRSMLQSVASVPTNQQRR